VTWGTLVKHTTVKIMALITPGVNGFLSLEAEMEGLLKVKAQAELHRPCRRTVEDLDNMRQQLEQDPLPANGKLIEELEIEATKLTRGMRKTLLQITNRHGPDIQK
jgi:hypothetical protein